MRHFLVVLLLIGLWEDMTGAAHYDGSVSSELATAPEEGSQIAIVQQRLEGALGEPLNVSSSQYELLKNGRQWGQVENANDLLEYAFTGAVSQDVETFQQIVHALDARDPRAINKRFKSGVTLPLLLTENGTIKPQWPTGKMFDSVLNLKQLDPNQKTADGHTLLGLFAFTGNEHYCRRVLARPNTDVNAQDNTGYTPFHTAIINGHLKVMALLHEKKANINIPTYDGKTPLITSLFFRVDDNEKVSNYPDTIPMELVGWGANLNASTQRGMTAITLAIMNRARWPLAEFFLNQKKVNLSYVMPEWGVNYVHCLALFPNISKDIRDLTNQEMLMVKKLIEKIAKNDTNLLLMLSKSGNNPLHDAAAWGPISNNLVKSFLQVAKQLGIPNYVNSQTETGRTILHTAAAWGNTDLISFLLRNGANPTLKDQAGHSAKDIAIAGGEAQALALLSSAAGPQKKAATSTASKKSAKDKKRNKKQKEAEKQQEEESEEENEGLSGQLESCSLHGVTESGAPCTSSTSSSLQAVSSATKQNFSQKKQAHKIALDALVNLNLIPAPAGVRALRQRGENSGVLVGYINPEAHENAIHPSIESGRYKCNQQKEANILDKYHSFHRDWDKYILGDGIKVTYEDRDRYQQLLDRYCLNAAPGYIFYILPGRIEDPAYDVQRALLDQETVSPFRGHHGAFIIIMSTNGGIIHRQFHASQEQRMARRAFGW